MKQNFALTLSLIGGLMLLASACVKEKTDDEKLRPVGSEIIFSAATSYDNDDRTRTVYTGKDQSGNDVTTNSTIERIDWENNDRVSIVYATGSSQSEYKVTNVLSSNNENDLADVVATGTKLTWASGDNQVFYAMYPTANGNHANSAASLSGTTVSGTIPSSQSLGTSNNTQNHPKYLPDMKYAYMVGYANNSCIDGSRVTIPFTPAVTAFNFIFKAASTVTVTGFEMTTAEAGSVGTTLAGDFNFNISGSKMRNNQVVGATWGTVNRTGPSNDNGKTITVSFGQDITLDANQYLDFTVFTLPIAQTGITIKFHLKNVTNGVTTNYDKTLDLKDGASTWHTFAAGKKHVVTNDKLAGDTITYYFNTSDGGVSFEYTGGRKTYNVRSYKQIGSKSEDRIPVQWQVTGYSTNGGSSWTTTKPAYLTEFTTNRTPTQTTAESFYATVAATPRTGTLGGKTAKGSEDAPFDLSKWSNRTGKAVEETTANCYIVDAPGWYMFPLRYGATRKDGTTITQAYNPDDNTEDHYLNRFFDHLGGNMGVNIANQSTFTINSVTLLWQDSKNLVTQVGFYGHTPGQKHEGGYVKFYVAPEYINPGNAVIAVKDANGKIAWSWHIWVTDQNMKPTTVRGKSFMTVNLGYCDRGSYTNNARTIHVKFKQAESGIEDILVITQNANSETLELYKSNPHYQWGRKDPMIPPKGLGETGNKPWYNASGTESTTCSITNGTITVANAIQNPMKMYTPTANGDVADWATTSYNNLWNYNQIAIPTGSTSTPASTHTNSVSGHGKTAYDPCPIGYMVPTARDFRYFHSNTGYCLAFMPSSAFYPKPTWSNGYTIKENTTVTSGTNDAKTSADNFWPAMGQRAWNSTTSSITDNSGNNFGSFGYYHTSVPYTSSSKHHLYLEIHATFPGTSSYQGMYMTQSAKSCARSVRCVAE